MANYFNIVLDTTAPSNPALSVNGGATYTTSASVSLAIGTGDGSTTGYQMKIWGDVDLTADVNVQGTELNSAWITYSTSKSVTLSSTDGSKTVYVKIRDEVWNESSSASDSIILDTTKPQVTTTSPDVSKISEVSGRDVASFSFSVDSSFVEYKVKLVNSSGASHDTGTQIPTTAGSTNMSGTGAYASATPIDCQIDGTDLKTVAGTDGTKTIKVFAQDEAGLWSV